MSTAPAGRYSDTAKKKRKNMSKEGMAPWASHLISTNSTIVRGILGLRL